jgi:iron complex transport system substrate-binding protein
VAGPRPGRGVVSAVLGVMSALYSLGAWAIDVVDDRGRNVHLDQPASRIVTLAPHLTELVYAAGGGARLVGVVEYSDFPPSARKLPRVGNASGIDLEGVLALRPDLVAAWRSGNDPRTVQRLEQLGLTVYVTEPAGPEEVARQVRQLGRLMGTDVVAEKAARDLLGTLQGLRRRYQHRRAVSVFLEIDHHPLITVGGAHIISKLIAICGGRNALGTLTGVAPVVDPEAVLRADPDIIVAMGPGASAWLNEWRRWPQLRAVHSGRLAVVAEDWVARPGPRLVLGAQQLCGVLEEARHAPK